MEKTEVLVILKKLAVSLNFQLLLKALLCFPSSVEKKSETYLPAEMPGQVAGTGWNCMKEARPSTAACTSLFTGRLQH